MRGGTAESRVVPLRKKSDIRQGAGQKRGGGLHLEESANQNNIERGG